MTDFVMREFFFQSQTSSNDVERRAIHKKILTASIFFSLISSVTTGWHLIDGTRERGCTLYN